MSRKRFALNRPVWGGFYSAFIVAEKVEVLTRRADLPATAAVLWESSGEADYAIASAEKAERGTTIILYLKAGEEEFADGWRLRSIIKNILTIFLCLL